MILISVLKRQKILRVKKAATATARLAVSGSVCIEEGGKKKREKRQLSAKLLLELMKCFVWKMKKKSDKCS